MNNNCPSCGSVYGVTAQHIGREFACKKCGAGLVVTNEGLQLAAAAAGATMPVGQAGFPSGFGQEQESSAPVEDESSGAATVRPGRMAATKRRASGGGDATIFALAAGAWGLGGLVTIIMAIMKTVYTPAAIGATFLLGGPLLAFAVYQVMNAIQDVQKSLTDLKSQSEQK